MIRKVERIPVDNCNAYSCVACVTRSARSHTCPVICFPRNGPTRICLSTVVARSVRRLRGTVVVIRSSVHSLVLLCSRSVRLLRHSIPSLCLFSTLFLSLASFVARIRRESRGICKPHGFRCIARSNPQLRKYRRLGRLTGGARRAPVRHERRARRGFCGPKAR